MAPTKPKKSIVHPRTYNTRSKISRQANAVVKDLRLLPELLKKLHEVEKPVVPHTPPKAEPVIPAPFVAFHEDDELNVCIWKVMADHRGRTATDIIRIIEKYIDYQRPEIHQAIMALNNIGWFMMLVSTTSGGNSNIYTLKQGIEMPSAQKLEKNNVTPFKQPEGLNGANPVGTIIPSEGMDVCIWKAMSDYKARSATEIGDILAAFGMNKIAVKDRAMVLMRRGWFSRNESKRPTTYTLKKGIKMPAIEQPKEDLPMGKDKTKSGPVSLIHNNGRKDQPAARAPHRAPVSAAAPIGAVPPAATAAPVSTGTELLEQLKLIPSAEDGVELCIWKVMHDHEPYTADEVAVLLEHTGIKAKTITVRMSKLYSKGWFTRSQKPGAGCTYTYVLKDGTAKPKAEAYTGYKLPAAEATPPVEAKPLQGTLKLVKEEPKAEEPKVEEPIAPVPANRAEDKKPDAVLPTVQTKPPVDEVKPAIAPTAKSSELVSFHVTVKGTNYTVQQAEQLTKALKATVVDVDGRPFTLEEAIELRDALIGAGFGEVA